MINAFNGTPFTGYVSLTNGGLGPTNFALFVNGASYSLPANGTNPGQNERLYITNITLSSNDTTQALITIDDGASTPRKLMSTYLSTTQPPAVENIPPGVCRLEFGTYPRATASAVTAAKTVECVIKGYISRT